MYKAFTLFELSIVLVIIGLIVSGVVAGQELIRNAELSAISREIGQFETAVNSFRYKYDAIPGDFNNAEAYWGTMSAGTCPNASGGTGTQTCDGNGNGKVERSGTGNQSNETFTFWQHLANADMLEGSYTGRSGPTGAYDAFANINVPDSRAEGYWYLYGLNTTVSNHAQYFDGTYGSYWQYGAKRNTDNSGSVLTPAEAKQIDLKLDDGLPGKGKVTMRFWDNCTNADNAGETSEDYLLSENTATCVLMYNLPY